MAKEYWLRQRMEKYCLGAISESIGLLDRRYLHGCHYQSRIRQKGGKNDQTDLFVHHPVMQYGNYYINEKVTRIWEVQNEGTD